MSKPTVLSNLAFLLPVMFYNIVEALLVSIIISILWYIFMNDLWGLGYFQFVTIYWIVKMINFNVFGLITKIVPPVEEPNHEPNNVNYNEKH